MPQIKFPNPAGNGADGKPLADIEYTGITLGVFGGVETFIILDESGHLTTKNRVPAKAAPAPAPTPAPVVVPATTPAA